MRTTSADPCTAMAALIGDRRRALDDLERALNAYHAMFRAPLGIHDGKAGKQKRRSRITAGSLEDRILALTKQPSTLKDLIAGAGARTHDVKAAIKALMTSGRLARTGWSRGARYRRYVAP